MQLLMRMMSSSIYKLRSSVLRSNKLRGGFLLLYVSMVLAFVLVIIMLSVPHFAGLKRHVARTELGNLKTFITYVSRVATATGITQKIVIDTERGTLTGAGRVHRLARGLRFGVPATVLGPPANPTAPVHDPVTFPDHCILCYAQGTVQAGTLYVTDDAQRVYALSSGVSPVSYVRTYYYDGTWKRCV